MGPTIGDGIDPASDHGTALCNMLGIDPAQVTAIHVDIVAGTGSVIRWESIRRIPLRIIADAITDAVNQDDNESADRAAAADAAPKVSDLWQGPEPPC